jgi:hypothetical protein
VHLDRISFRLSLWAMAAQVIQDIIYITLYAPVSDGSGQQPIHIRAAVMEA